MFRPEIFQYKNNKRISSRNVHKEKSTNKPLKEEMRFNCNVVVLDGNQAFIILY